jgi:hypothetical protein
MTPPEMDDDGPNCLQALSGYHPGEHPLARAGGPLAAGGPPVPPPLSAVVSASPAPPPLVLRPPRHSTTPLSGGTPQQSQPDAVSEAGECPCVCPFLCPCSSCRCSPTPLLLLLIVFLYVSWSEDRFLGPERRGVIRAVHQRSAVGGSGGHSPPGAGTGPTPEPSRSPTGAPFF